MSLGPDNTLCKDEYVNAMRARLAAESPELAANVDNEGVQKNFAALAEALFRVLTVRAETSSDAAADAAFFAWVANLVVWAQGMSTWQTGMRQAFQSWAAPPGADQNFKNAVLALTSPGAPPVAPTSLKGRVK